jgi:hypothetical protein
VIAQLIGTVAGSIRVDGIGARRDSLLWLGHSNPLLENPFHCCDARMFCLVLLIFFNVRNHDHCLAVVGLSQVPLVLENEPVPVPCFLLMV